MVLGIKETSYGIFLQCDKASYVAKKLVLPGLLSGTLYELNLHDTHKVTHKLLKRWDGSSEFQIHQRNCCQTLYRTQKIATDKICTKQKRSSTFLLYWKVCQILWACRLKMDATTLQKNFGWLSRQQDLSVISRTL